jgi:hypothetical protein
MQRAFSRSISVTERRSTCPPPQQFWRSQSALASPNVSSTCLGTMRPKKPAAKTARITTAMIFFMTLRLTHYSRARSPARANRNVFSTEPKPAQIGAIRLLRQRPHQFHSHNSALVTKFIIERCRVLRKYPCRKFQYLRALTQPKFSCWQPVSSC